MFFQDQSGSLFDDELEDIDNELGSFLNTLNTKNKPQNQGYQKKSFGRQAPQQSRNFVKKVIMPRQFQKAKRTLGKIVNDYFNDLKSEFERCTALIQKSDMSYKMKKTAISFYLKKDKIKTIIQSISQFIGIRHRYNNITDLKYNYLQELLKKNGYQTYRGSYCYCPESQKIIGLNIKGQITEIKISSKIQKFRLPEYATPVPFKDAFYLLDPGVLNRRQKRFLPDNNVYRISDKGDVTILDKKPIRQRIKCAIVRDEQFIYLLGGMVGQNKVIVNSCQKFCTKKSEFIQIPSFNKKHRCPSACMLKNTIWLFSTNGIEKLQKGLNQWIGIQLPFQLQIFPFQFVTPYSETQILIFGGTGGRSNGLSVKIYNLQYNWVDTFHDIVPLPISNQRVWGPSYTESGLTILSAVQAQKQPDLKQKNHIVQAMYFTTNGIILHGITLTK